MGFFRKEPARQESTVIPESSLSTLNPGEEGIITTVSGTSLLTSRLRELGVVPGVLVRVLRGDCPLVIQVGEGRLCLRKRDADPILVNFSRPPVSPNPLLR
jgi:Fe2+ transport system protein FeoA